MRNTLNALAVAAALTGCDKPKEIDQNSSPDEILAANADCNEDFAQCPDSTTGCLLEWDTCMQDIREKCAGVSGSFLNNPTLNSDGDNAADLDEAAAGYTSLCHRDENPLTCSNIPEGDCDGSGILGDKVLARSLQLFFEAQNGQN